MQGLESLASLIIMDISKSDFPDHFSLQAGQSHSTAFIANTAQLIGQVYLGEQSSVWYQTVLRADLNRIEIGKRSNIQDGSIVHLENDLPCRVGDDVTVGHGAILHACDIKDAALVGMGAIILNGAVVGKGAVVAAGAVVKEGEIVPDCTMWAGIPAKQIKILDEESIIKNQRWAAKYVRLAQEHQAFSQK